MGLRWLSINPAHATFFCFFNDTATTEIYTLSLHDALPIWVLVVREHGDELLGALDGLGPVLDVVARSEEHTSELQSRSDFVCRLLLAKRSGAGARTARAISDEVRAARTKRPGRDGRPSP